ncbi:MAG: cysteine desulfurase family protein [Alphaproteobacteria bacterium]
MAVDIYLDHNATTPVHPEVAQAMSDALAQTGNPSSVHRFGRLVRRTVDDAREDVARLVGANAANVVFTSGGTEANNQALRGFDRRVLVSAVEHDSVLAARNDADIIRVDNDGRLDLTHLRELLEANDRPSLVSVMYANNETGVVQPIVEAVALAHEFGALVHCDAIQAAGKLPVSLPALGVDLLTLSAHKIGGPQGIGALVLRDGLELDALLRGGGQERRRRAGTENVAGISGFGVAARLAAERLADYSEIAVLRDQMEARVLAAAPDATIHGAGYQRLANTSCIGLPGITGEMQVMTLDLAGIAVSAGSACSSGKVTPSHVLRAMGCDDSEAKNAIRVSLGATTSAAELDRFVDVWANMAGRRQGEAEIRRSVA